MRLIFLNIVLLIFTSFSPIFAQNSGAVKVPASASRLNILELKDVKEGMTGTARTVFRGTQSEPFDVEILGVLPNGVGPRQDLIIGKISGGSAERTQVFAGMSGSPVYIGGKLVGAISYAFPFSTEAICGITPIEQMISIFEHAVDELPNAKKPKVYSFSELAATEWNPDYSAAEVKTGSVTMSSTSAAVNSLAGQSFRPIGTPLSFSGFSNKTLELFGPDFIRMGMIPVTGISSGSRPGGLSKASENTLVGGDSVAVELARGDFAIAASGTVTLRDGDRIYAFGHPFLSLGASDMPMSESSVITVVPSVSNSFKISVADSLVGSVTQDRATGVFGSLGKAPKMIPVTLKLQTSRNRRETLNYEIVNDEFLTPLLINVSVFNAITAHERNIGDLTVSIDGSINLKDNEPISISSRFAGPASARLAANAVVIPTANLVASKFDDLKIDGIELDIKSYDESKTAVLQRIAVDRAQARPGETVEVEAFIRTYSGKILSQKIPFTVPTSTPYGRLKLTVGDGNVLQFSAAEQQFEPKNLAELVTTINKFKKNDRLYLQASRTTTGAIIGSSELPNLPPSVLATLNTNRTSGVYKPTVESIVAEIEIPQAEYVIEGRQEVEIRVVN